MKLLKKVILLSILLITINIKANASETATVTIGYNDINGHVIKEKKDKCTVGKDYTATAITISGYELTTETPKKHQQLREDFTFETFVPGDNSIYAYNASIAAANFSSSLSSLS